LIHLKSNGLPARPARLSPAAGLITGSFGAV
jgi:hypothetical protein